MTGSINAVTAGLRRWVHRHDLHVQAAVYLLLKHDCWLQRADFRRACVHAGSDGGHWIDWRAARAAFDAGTFNRASSTELAVLDFAIALGSDRYRFQAMGSANARALIDAVTYALKGPR